MGSYWIDAASCLRRARDFALPRITVRVRAIRFRLIYRREPPPRWSDLTGYEAIVAQMHRWNVADIPGDALEIGAFVGGGTVKLAAFFEKYAPGKRVYVIDVFDADVDTTATVDGHQMNTLYARSLAGRDQRELFDQVTHGWSNVNVIAGDSAAVDLPTSQLCFAMIDGNHDPSYVRSDFSTVWSRLSPGGVVAVHDYGHDLPDVTHTINALVGEHADELAGFWTVGIIAFLRREPLRRVETVRSA